MANPEVEVDRLLRESGAVLARNKKHEVWKIPGGKTFVKASTPSDRRATANQLSDLRKVLEVEDPERGKPGERRQHKLKTESRPDVAILNGGRGGSSLQEQLSVSGMVEEKLGATIARLNNIISNQRNEITRLNTLRRACLGCRIYAAWFRFKRWIFPVPGGAR
jgi:hypothetical protein